MFVRVTVGIGVWTGTGVRAGRPHYPFLWVVFPAIRRRACQCRNEEDNDREGQRWASEEAWSKM